jgi:hypothetical protein
MSAELAERDRRYVAHQTFFKDRRIRAREREPGRAVVCILACG